MQSADVIYHGLLLGELEKSGQIGEEFGLRWVCRNSTSGRGLRLHQALPDVFDIVSNVYGVTVVDKVHRAFATPQEAIEHFLKTQNENTV